MSENRQAGMNPEWAKGVASPPSPLDNPIARRARALELAIDTMRTVREFTNYQVVHTAALFDEFLRTGTTPPQAEGVISGDV